MIFHSCRLQTVFHSLLKVSYQKSGPDYSNTAKVTYGDWACTLQLQEVREMVVLEVQAVQEDLDAHHNQSLVVQVVPEVQEHPLLILPLDPSMKGKGKFERRDCFKYLSCMCIISLCVHFTANIRDVKVNLRLFIPIFHLTHLQARFARRPLWALCSSKTWVIKSITRLSLFSLHTLFSTLSLQLILLAVV